MRLVCLGSLSRAGDADARGLPTAQNLVPGTLGGTYGGGPLACAAAVATLDVIEGEGLLQNAEARGRQLVAVRAQSHRKRGFLGP